MKYNGRFIKLRENILRAAEYVKFQKRCDDASLSGFYVLGIP
jgi:hypothetical protein